MLIEEGNQAAFSPVAEHARGSLPSSPMFLNGHRRRTIQQSAPPSLTTRSRLAEMSTDWGMTRHIPRNVLPEHERHESHQVCRRTPNRLCRWPISGDLDTSSKESDSPTPERPKCQMKFFHEHTDYAHPQPVYDLALAAPKLSHLPCDACSLPPQSFFRPFLPGSADFIFVALVEVQSCVFVAQHLFLILALSWDLVAPVEQNGRMTTWRFIRPMAKNLTKKHCTSSRDEHRNPTAWRGTSNTSANSSPSKTLSKLSSTTSSNARGQHSQATSRS